MKIAAVYSGLYREFNGWKENHELITDHCDKILYTTWKDSPVPPIENCLLFDEPVVEYNPFTAPKFAEKYPRIHKAHKENPGKAWLTKQVIAHQLAVDSLEEEYDVIIKMRYDLWIGRHNWISFFKKCFEEKTVIAFGGWTGAIDLDKTVCEKLIVPNDSNSGGKLKDSLCDFMIIHPGYKMKGAIELHEQKKLYPANQGWYQVLVEPYNDAHINYGGGAMLARYREDKVKHTPGKV